MVRKLNVAIAILAVFGITIVAVDTARGASPAVTWTGDRTLVTAFRLDDGMTGAAGFKRARWTSTAPVHAVLQLRNAKGRVVATQLGGNPYSRSAALTWITPLPTGVYRVTLTLTAYVYGSQSQLTTRSVSAAWTARL